jgi:hypothetical protein
MSSGDLSLVARKRTDWADERLKEQSFNTCCSYAIKFS